MKKFKRKIKVTPMVPTSRECSLDAYQKHADAPESKPAGLND